MTPAERESFTLLIRHHRLRRILEVEIEEARVLGLQTAPLEKVVTDSEFATSTILDTL